MTQFVHIRTRVALINLPKLSIPGLMNAMGECITLWIQGGDPEALAQLTQALRGTNIKFRVHDCPAELMTAEAFITRGLTGAACTLCAAEDASPEPTPTYFALHFSHANEAMQAVWGQEVGMQLPRTSFHLSANGMDATVWTDSPEGEARFRAVLITMSVDFVEGDEQQVRTWLDGVFR